LAQARSMAQLWGFVGSPLSSPTRSGAVATLRIAPLPRVLSCVSPSGGGGSCNGGGRGETPPPPPTAALAAMPLHGPPGLLPLPDDTDSCGSSNEAAARVLGAAVLPPGGKPKQQKRRPSPGNIAAREGKSSDVGPATRGPSQIASASGQASAAAAAGATAASGASRPPRIRFWDAMRRPVSSSKSSSQAAAFEECGVGRDGEGGGASGRPPALHRDNFVAPPAIAVDPPAVGIACADGADRPEGKRSRCRWLPCFGAGDDSWGATAARKRPASPSDSASISEETGTSADIRNAVGGRFGFTGGGDTFAGTMADFHTTVRSAVSAWNRSHAKEFFADWFDPLAATLETEVLPGVTVTSSAFDHSGGRLEDTWGESSQPARMMTASAYGFRRQWSCWHLPVFVGLQAAVTICLHVAGEFGLLDDLTLPGEEEPFFPGRTMLLVQYDCKDQRSEVWRWLTYQLTHTSFWHLGMNVVVLLIAGIPLERLHGAARLAPMFNVGVLGGACCYFVSDPHTQVVGMSGGCYSLQGMFLAHLLTNWCDMWYPLEKLAFLLALALVDVVNAQLTWNSHSSHSIHFGGYVAGFCIGMVAGRQGALSQRTPAMRVAFAALGCILVAFCVVWNATAWPPSEIWEGVEWCWARQVRNESLFGHGGFFCVRCGDAACIDRWSAQDELLEVNNRVCAERGWAATER